MTASSPRSKRPYLRLLSATSLSNFGDGIRVAALPLLGTTLTDRPVLIAGIAAASSLPWLLLGMVAGAIADRADRRRLAAGADLARLGLLVILLATLLTGQAGLVLIYLVAFGCGVAETVRDTLTATLVPPLVDRDRLDRANGHLVNAEVAGNELLGPPAGGYLFGLAVALPFAINSGLLAVSAALLTSLPHLFAPTRPAAPAPVSDSANRSGCNLLVDIADGARFLARHRRLRTAALLGAVFALADSAWFPLLVLYSQHILGLPESGFGLLLAVGAAGGLLGAACAAAAARRLGATGALTGSLTLAAAAQAALGLTAHAIVAAAALAASSFAFGIWNVVTVTLRQTMTPPHLLGRVNGTYRTLQLGVAPLGALLGGLLAGVLGLRAPMLLGVPVLVVAAVVGVAGLREHGNTSL